MNNTLKTSLVLCDLDHLLLGTDGMAFPKEADELFSQAEKMAKLRYQTYVRKSQEDWSEQI